MPGPRISCPNQLIGRSWAIAFVRDLPQNPDAIAIALAIIAMAHSLGLRAIAEGVETQTQFDFLKEQGCDEVQGFLFSQAIPALEFVQFLDNPGPALRLPPPVLLKAA